MMFTMTTVTEADFQPVTGEPSMWTSDNHTMTSDSYKDFYETAQFITGLVLYPIICILGITANVLTLIVLSHRKMLTSTNVFLSALAIADIIKLLNDTLYSLDLILIREVPYHGNRMLGYMYPFSHYIFNQSVCVASWLTVSVAVERYISVCHPTKAKEMCTVHRARIVSLLVFVVMSLVAVPSAFRYKRETVVDPVTNQTTFSIGLTALGKDKTFIDAYTWVQNLLRSVIPLLVLIVLNARIIHALRAERVKGKKMSARNRITFTLIIVIIVFLICITPDAIMSTCFGFGYVDESDLVKGIREFTDTLLAVNSAVNFLVYCLCSKMFRDIFKERFCMCCCPNMRYSMVAHNNAQCKPAGSPMQMTKSGGPDTERLVSCNSVLPEQHDNTVSTLTTNGKQTLCVTPQTSL